MPADTVALFVTCLVDFFRPAIGFAAVKLLEQQGYRVEVPIQSCCGQPGYNSGDLPRARAVAREFINAFDGYDAIVAPSGSCASMVARHLPELFDDSDPEMQARAIRVAERTHELSAFLARRSPPPAARLETRVTYHDSCSGLRELGVKDQPRSLLSRVEGLELVEYSGAERCCGFGGTFCVKYSDISTAMCSARCREIEDTGAQVLAGGDLGCLLNLAGSLSRSGSSVQVRHWAEVCAGLCELPPIGASE